MRYFKIEEFNCKETGENQMRPDFLQKIDRLREACGFPFIITSGYRSTKHSAEINKAAGGTHTQGIAADIYCLSSIERMKIVRLAMQQGFTGIGVAKNFIHVDTRKSSPLMWTYQ